MSHILRPAVLVVTSLLLKGPKADSEVDASPIAIATRDDGPKKGDSFFLSLVSTILITILAAAILIVFYRYAVKYIPSNTIRIPLKVFSHVGPDGMIRLPTSEEESTHMNTTFPEDEVDETEPERRFHDDDDDIPPPVPPKNVKSFKIAPSEADFFDISDDEEEQEPRPVVPAKPAGQDEGTKAWRE